MNDFDFLIGSWKVANRRLRTVLEGRDDWYEFPGRSTCRQILDGVGNLDEIEFPTLGFSGCTVRLFDLERKEWSIYWASSRSGVLGTPVVGTFADGRGDFYGDEDYEGRPIRCHFIWSHITLDSARWEQEFSVDGGETWETNWVMDLTRA